MTIFCWQWPVKLKVRFYWVQNRLLIYKLLAADTYNRATVSSTYQTAAYCSEAFIHTDLWAQLLDSASSKVSISCSCGARLLSAPASQAYVETVFYVRGDLTAGKRNRLTKNLELHAFLKVNLKYYAQFGLGCSR